MTDITVIAFDPGETTGWCWMKVDTSALTPPLRNDLDDEVRLGGWDYGQIDCRAVPSSAMADKMTHQHLGLNALGENIGITEMLNLVVSAPNPAIVIEDFVLDPGTQLSAGGSRNLLSPVRLTSALQFGMYWEEIGGEIFIQGRTDPKRICTDARLTEWNLNPAGGHEYRHARDAARHAFHFLRSVRGGTTAAEEKRWRAWPHLFTDPYVVGRAAMKTDKPTRTKPLGERIPGL